MDGNYWIGVTAVLDTLYIWYSTKIIIRMANTQNKKDWS